MTWADLHFYSAVETMRFIAPKSADSLKPFPRLQALFDRVGANPKVAEYIKKRPPLSDSHH